MKTFFLTIASVIVIAGCNLHDYEKSKSEKILGNIYVVNLNIPEQPGYYAVFLWKSGFEQHLLKDGDQIDYLTGNDSVLLVKTKDLPTSNYYLIRHKMGDSILSIRNLSKFDFEEHKSELQEKYSFRDTDVK